MKRLEMLKDYLSLAVNCNGDYFHTEYWTRKYWPNSEKKLKKLKEKGKCDCEILKFLHEKNTT